MILRAYAALLWTVGGLLAVISFLFMLVPAFGVPAFEKLSAHRRDVLVEIAWHRQWNLRDRERRALRRKLNLGP